MKNKFIAHVRRNPDGLCVTQSLEDHLNAVAKIAGEFAATFGNKDWGELLGYWHDLGKFLPARQSYLARETGCNEEAHIEGIGNRPNHSSADAVLAFDKVQPLHPDIRHGGNTCRQFYRLNLFALKYQAITHASRDRR